MIMNKNMYVYVQSLNGDLIFKLIYLGEPKSCDLPLMRPLE